MGYSSNLRHIIGIIYNPTTMVIETESKTTEGPRLKHTEQRSPLKSAVTRSLIYNGNHDITV